MLKKEEIDIEGKGTGNNVRNESGSNECDCRGDPNFVHGKNWICPCCEERVFH